MLSSIAPMGLASLLSRAAPLAAGIVPGIDLTAEYAADGASCRALLRDEVF